MKWLKNMKVAGKLLLLVVPFLIILIGFVVFFSIRSSQIEHDSKEALYSEAFVSTAAVLNADRDFYQAAIAEQEIYLKGKSIDAAAKDGLLVLYEENAAQTHDRIQLSLENVSDNKELYSTYKHEATGLTLEQLGVSFMADFNQWKSLYDPATGTGNMAEKQSVFDKAREEINVMTEILENYANYRSAQIDQDVSSSIYITVGFVAAILLLFSALSLYLILYLRSSIRSATDLSRKIAQGDLSVEVDKKMLTGDEIGQLTATIDSDVREAFKDIEHARVVADKQAKYQSGEVDKLVVNLERLSKGELFCDMAAQEADSDTAELHELYGRISDTLHRTVDTLKSYIDEISLVLHEMSEANLEVEISSDYKGDFVKLKDSLNSIIASFNTTLTEINSSAEQVASGTKQVSGGSQVISQGATEQAASIEELSATITQISEQIVQNAKNAGNANSLAKKAQENAAAGNGHMKEMQQAMEEINVSSENISKIIKVIDDIAFQTNILALNAAVEAARAGIHGKGFAVVAEEVRNLAAKSAGAAKETAELIEGSIKKVETGTKIADNTASALSEIVTGIEEAARLVGDIAVASEQQAAGIRQVNSGIDQLSAVVQSNSATAQEAAAASEELSSQAELLKAMVGNFRLKDQESVEVEMKVTERPAAAKKKVVLDDGEFGKY